jgi:hypothetical protein
MRFPTESHMLLNTLKFKMKKPILGFLGVQAFPLSFCFVSFAFLIFVQSALPW